MTCPSCGKNAGTVCRCENCGEVRCSMGTCVGSTGRGAGGTPGNLCKACKKGKYRKIS